MTLQYYKGQNGVGRKSDAQKKKELEECSFKVKRGKFIVEFDKIESQQDISKVLSLK
tara:strand:- start:419 stop:589 length:171 start_codon:yes stop_codon:yes gene_type:complete